MVSIYTSDSGLIYLTAVTAIVLVLRGLRGSIALFWLASLPGTIAHELSHFVAATLLNARPCGFSIVPSRTASGYTLGSVRLRNIRWYNGLIVGLAPISLLALAALVVAWRLSVLKHRVQVEEIAWGYLAACLVLGCVPSRDDLRIAAASAWVVLGAAAVVAWYCFVGMRPA
jgi:hypothetical protein